MFDPEFVLSLPMGRCVLTHFGHDLAALRAPFAAADPAKADQRLHVKSWVKRGTVHSAPDGVFVHPMMLLAVCWSIIPRGKVVPVKQIEQQLFWSAQNADLQKVLIDLHENLLPGDPVWNRRNGLATHGRFNAEAGTLERFSCVVPVHSSR